LDITIFKKYFIFFDLKKKFDNISIKLLKLKFNIYRAPEKKVESHQQTVALPLLNHNNHNKHDNNASKGDEDEFAGLLG